MLVILPFFGGSGCVGELPAGSFGVGGIPSFPAFCFFIMCPCIIFGTYKIFIN